MKIELMTIIKLNEAEYNPRVKLEPEMPEYEKLKRLIQLFGFVDPPIFNTQTKNLVDGHQRVQGAKDLGYTEINVSIVDMSLEKEKQLNVALNKISGKWDDTKLTILLKEFESDVLEFTGFDQSEALTFSFAPSTVCDTAVKTNPPKIKKTKLANIIFFILSLLIPLIIG